MSYIEREALREEIESLSVTLCGKELFGELAKHSVAQKINEAPTADVVEVVRCKDCMYFTGKDYDGCCIKNGLATRYANDFCSYGERSENGK